MRGILLVPMVFVMVASDRGDGASSTRRGCTTTSIRFRR